MLFRQPTFTHETMKRFSIFGTILLGIFLSHCVAQKNATPINTSSNGITVKDTAKHQQIDWDQFAIDLKYYQDSTGFPIHPGVFPTKVYDSEGNGSLLFETTINGQHFVGRSVFVYKGDYNQGLFTGNDESMVYFTILVRTDINAENDVFVSSRNHPVYVAEGNIVTEGTGVDWVAIQPSDAAGSALVNMRYFDMNAGRLVIVCPQTDKSLRFLQISTPFLNDASVKDYVLENSSSESWVSFVRGN